MRRTVFTSKFLMLILLVLIMACASTKILAPQKLKAPEPIEDNTGKYLCPYTSDGTMAEWIDKGVAARFGSAIGGYAGKKAGQKAVESVPIIGGLLGKKAGKSIGRSVAIECCGGWDTMRASTDLSFNSKDDLALWMYVNHSRDEKYDKVLQLTMEIYPELKDGYTKALQKASKNR